MLPDVSKRRRLYGFDQKQYDGMQLRKILETKNHDGVTTKNAVEIVRRMNDYLERSRYLVVQASAIFYFIKDIMDGELDHHECELLRMYAERIDRGLLGSSMYNMMRIIKSVAAQRRLTKGVKNIIKKNKVSKDWEALLNKFLDELDQRLIYLSDITIPANLANTPMGAYADYLSAHGTSVYDDIRSFISNNGAIFDEDNMDVPEYKEHVIAILCGLGGDELESLIKKAEDGMAVRNKRMDKIRQSIAESDAEELERASDDCSAMVLSLCSAAGKKFRAERMNALMRRASGHTSVWVVAAGRAKPMRAGYLSKSGRNYIWRVGNVRAARIFNTEEEAQTARNEYLAQGDHLYAETAEVELASYGIGL